VRHLDTSPNVAAQSSSHQRRDDATNQTTAQAAVTHRGRSSWRGSTRSTRRPPPRPATSPALATAMANACANYVASMQAQVSLVLLRPQRVHRRGASGAGADEL